MATDRGSLVRDVVRRHEVGATGGIRALSDAILYRRGALSRAASARRYLAQRRRSSTAHRFFHWELEFPEVFFAADGTRLPDGGLRRRPRQSAVGHDSRGRRRRRRSTPRAALCVRFTRDAGVYAAQSDGHANCYQLFLERGIA